MVAGEPDTTDVALGLPRIADTRWAPSSMNFSAQHFGTDELRENTSSPAPSGAPRFSLFVRERAQPRHPLPAPGHRWALAQPED